MVIVQKFGHLYICRWLFLFQKVKIMFNSNIKEDKANIILPIKPIYAEKILAGEKKYEYRKRLCQSDIKKIYIYATAPVKMIIGEAEVIEKIMGDKIALWEQTKCFSGISKEFYDKYFGNQGYACAYCIGKVRRYSNPFSLDSIGIESVPQMFVYCGEIEN